MWDCVNFVLLQAGDSCPLLRQGPLNWDKSNHRPLFDIYWIKVKQKVPFFPVDPLKPLKNLSRSMWTTSIHTTNPLMTKKVTPVKHSTPNQLKNNNNGIFLSVYFGRVGNLFYCQSSGSFAMSSFFVLPVNAARRSVNPQHPWRGSGALSDNEEPLCLWPGYGDM